MDVAIVFCQSFWAVLDKRTRLPSISLPEKWLSENIFYDENHICLGILVKWLKVKLLKRARKHHQDYSFITLANMKTSMFVAHMLQHNHIQLYITLSYTVWFSLTTWPVWHLMAKLSYWCTAKKKKPASSCILHKTESNLKAHWLAIH